MMGKRTFIVRTQVYDHGNWRPVYIKVNNGRFSALTERQVSIVQGSVDVIDLSTYYLTPGLVDCHVHLAMNAVSLQGAIDSWADDEAVRMHVAGALRQYRDAGVTYVRDGGDAAGIGLMARRMVDEEGLPGPQITACGHAIYKKGRYGDFLGPGIASIEEGFRQIDEAVQHTSCLKICQSGIVSFKTYGHVGAPQFTLEELTRLISYAHDKGFLAMVHASGEEAIDIAVRAGADTIEHGYFVSTDTMRRMAEQGTIWVPTLSPLANLLERPHLLYPGADLEVIKRAVDDHASRIELARDMGMRIALGTDAGAVGVNHGIPIYEEIEHMVSAGLPREIVFEMAYREGRRVIGKPIPRSADSVYGWQVGDVFDAVAYIKDPLKGPVEIGDIAAVYPPT
jgi:imidazolonepropionase-like amidohydrolase